MRQKALGAPHRKLEPRLAAVMCYLLGIISGIILLTIERENRFVRFHALQSILYSAFVVVVLLTLITAGLSTLSNALALTAVGVWLFLMYRAALGESFQLPGLGWLAERNA